MVQGNPAQTKSLGKKKYKDNIKKKGLAHPSGAG